MFSPQTCFIMPRPPCSPSITIASFKSAFHPWDSEEELPFRVTNEMSGTRNYLLQIQYAIIYLFIEKLLLRAGLKFFFKNGIIITFGSDLPPTKK